MRLRPDDHAWRAPPLSTASHTAQSLYRLGITALVAGTGQADLLLGEAVATDPDFFVAWVGLAVAKSITGLPYIPSRPTSRVLRGERQHAEIVEAALTGDYRRASGLRMEHLLEYPGDLLVVWLPMLQTPRRASRSSGFP